MEITTTGMLAKGQIVISSSFSSGLGIFILFNRNISSGLDSLTGESGCPVS
jgi:hypothetical protein